MPKLATMEAISNARPNNGNNIISKIFIERILTQEAQNIVQAQDRVLSANNPNGKDVIIAKRRFTVSANNLEFTHAMQQRFIDMKRLSGKKKKAVPVHNKIIYQHFNAIINQLAYGFTDQVKNLIANQYNIEL